MYACREFPDAIAFSAYPVDVHEAGNQGQNDASRRFASHAEENRYYWGKDPLPPLSRLGQCAGRQPADGGALHLRLLPGAGRVPHRAIVGAIGHAGGLAAALSAKAGIAPRDLDPNLLRETLRADGAYFLD